MKKQDVTFRDVRKSYGYFNAVKDLDFTIPAGEFLTLLGPSGSGKTSTLMMLAGFERPSAGDIVMGGQSITASPPYKRNIGIVFQNYALFPHMTIEENVAYPLKARRWAGADIQKQVNDALSMVKLEGLNTRKPRELSGGQQQRVALARALVFRPPLVLMDEPLGALDKQLRDHMQLEIKRIHRELGVTIVYVTHDQSEALAMSDRIAVFNRGTIQQLDRPDEIYERPTNAFVAGFVGESNQFKGIVEKVDGDRCLIRVDGGGAVEGVARQGLALGSKAIVSLRPDRVRIAGDAPAGTNVVRCPMMQTLYMGEFVRCTVTFVDGSEFSVRLPKGVSVAPGADGKVAIEWAAKDALVFADET